MNKNHVYKQRLLSLADFLQKLPKKRFNYNHWVGEDWGGKADLSCGTTACALGWATTMPAFRRLGLRLVNNEALGFGVVTMKGSNFDDDSSTDAAHQVFGLDNREFEYLFTPEGDSLSEIGLTERGPGEDATAKEVARHIRSFVKAKFG